MPFLSLPRHVAIIMDGNGRWAKQRGLPRLRGHEEGVKRAWETVEACRDLGIEVLTLYAFSSENWQRPPEEVEGLMSLLERYLREEVDRLGEHEVRLRAIGNISRLPPTVRQLLEEAMRRTEGQSGMVLNLALSYGGREEILRAVRQLVQRALQGEIQPENIDERIFASCLYTNGLPDPDLLIRTSGEMRLSNFLLWQLAYTELYVTPVLWPDFDRQELTRALEDYARRERRFGLTEEQLRGER